MKKIFIAMAVIFTMLLSVASPIMVKPINASAANVSYSNLSSPCEDVFQDYLNTATQPYWHPSTDNSVSLDSESKVIYLAAKQSRNGEPCDTLGLLLAFNNADYTFENGVITLDNVIRTNENSGYYKIVTYYWGGSRIDYWSNNTFKSAVIDLNNKSVILYANNGFTGDHQSEWYIQGNNTVINEFWDIESNITDLVPASLNVLVDFSPDLENTVFRAPLPDNGVTDYSKYFCMDITNNSRFGIQYFFALQEFPTDRTNINAYAPRPESGFCNALYSGQVYANEEWIYVHPFSANGIVKVLKPSQWHYIAAGESIHQDFSWSQFNLEKGKQYQAVVFAVKNDIGCASALNNYYNYAFNNDSDIAPFVIDFSEAECVYYSQFSIMNPVGYDPTDNKFGNYISSGDKSDAALYETKAYEDPTSGQLVIADKKTSGQDFENVVGAPTSGGSHGGGGYYTGSSYSGSSYNSYGGSFSSLNNYFSSFFAFISAVLNCFPSPYVVIITAGLSGLVVLGIIKVAIK